MKRRLQTVLFVMLLSLPFIRNAFADAPAKNGLELDTKELSAFDKFNLTRKMIGVGMDAKSAAQEKDEAQERIEKQFTAEILNETELAKATDQAKGAVASLAKVMGKMVEVLAEYAPDNSNMKTVDPSKANTAVVSEKAKSQDLTHEDDVQVPSSFSPDAIKRIRAMKARNKPARDALKGSLDVKDKAAMAKLVKADKIEREHFVKAIEETGIKGLLLSLEEYREMRSFLSPKEMKTYFTLQNQIKVEKARVAAEKAKAHNG